MLVDVNLSSAKPTVRATITKVYRHKFMPKRDQKPKVSVISILLMSERISCKVEVSLNFVAF